MSHELMHTLGFGHEITNLDTLSGMAKWARDPVINRWHSDASIVADRSDYRIKLLNNVYNYERVLK